MGAVAPPWASIYSSKLVYFCWGGRRLMSTRPGLRPGSGQRHAAAEVSCLGARGARAGWLHARIAAGHCRLRALFCRGGLQRGRRYARRLRGLRAGGSGRSGCSAGHCGGSGRCPVALWRCGCRSGLWRRAEPGRPSSQGGGGVASGALTKVRVELRLRIAAPVGAAALSRRRGRLLLERRFSLRPPEVR